MSFSTGKVTTVEKFHQTDVTVVVVVVVAVVNCIGLAEIETHSIGIRRKTLHSNDIENTSSRYTKMHRTAVTCGCGDLVLILHIDWSTIQSTEFTKTTVISHYMAFPTIGMQFEN